MIHFFDSHAHYDDERFGEEFEGGTDGAIMAAYNAGVDGIINVGSSVKTSENSIKLAEKYDFIRAAVGIHPCDCERIPVHMMAMSIDRISSMLEHEKVVALGEIGLDYHYDDTDEKRQKFFFDSQLWLAEEKNYPVIIHDRDAHGDVFDIVKSHKNSYGVIHSFSGSPEMARQLSDLGWYISFSGPITYKNARKVQEAAAIVPRDRLLIETDSPYLPPTPMRGKINYSAYLVYTCTVLANIIGLSVEETAALTEENAKRLFKYKTEKQN